jgi:hypothetical protein
VERAERQVHVNYVWRKTPAKSRGKALQWWLAQLDSAVTRAALLDRWPGPGGH